MIETVKSLMMDLTSVTVWNLSVLAVISPALNVDPPNVVWNVEKTENGLRAS